MDNPQDLINQALGNTTPTTPTEPATPTLPTPEPLTPAEPTTPTPPVSTDITNNATEPTTATTTVDAVVPTELTSDSATVPSSNPTPETMATVEPTTPEALNIEAKGEDVPLALVGAAPIAADAAPNSNPIVEPITQAVPPALTSTANNNDFSNEKPKKSGLKKVVGLMVGLLTVMGLVGGVGIYTYQRYGTIEPATIAKISDNNKDECQGCVNGGWLVWRDGQCKHTGICDSGVPGKDTDPPDAPPGVSPEDNCRAIGGEWCGNVVDASGKSHSFCGTKGKACYQSAIDNGITVNIGSVKCKQENGIWIPDGNYTDVGLSDEIPNPDAGLPDDKYGPTLSIYEQVDKQCKNQSGSFTSTGGKEMWICPVGTTVACTENVPGAKRFYGNELGCFCGVIQVDTTSGHTSYSSTCGCNQEEPVVSPSPSPSAGVPTFMCNTLTRTPATAPAIGTTYTFTCAGSSAPAGSVNLTYKFRYSRNDGAYTALTNKTATTAEMTVAQCGRYKVQCQACGTINGVLSCDPVWTPATTQ